MIVGLRKDYRIGRYWMWIGYAASFAWAVHARCCGSGPNALVFCLYFGMKLGLQDCWRFLALHDPLSSSFYPSTGCSDGICGLLKSCRRIVNASAIPKSECNGITNGPGRLPSSIFSGRMFFNCTRISGLQKDCKDFKGLVILLLWFDLWVALERILGSYEDCTELYWDWKTSLLLVLISGLRVLYTVLVPHILLLFLFSIGCSRIPVQSCNPVAIDRRNGRPFGLVLYSPAVWCMNCTGITMGF